MERDSGLEKQPYPVDARGLARHLWELPIGEGASRERMVFELHHYTDRDVRKLGHSLINLTFRQLHSQQDFMTVEDHRLIHATYEEPPLPTPAVMVEEIIFQHSIGETLRIQNHKDHEIFEIPITDIHLKQIQQEYNRIQKGESI